MSVSIIDSVTYESGSGGYTNVHTFSDVDVSGSDTCHIAVGFNRNPASDVSGWTSEGNAMTSVVDSINTNVCAVSVWRYLINNAATTTVSNTPSYKLQAGIAIGLEGVDQTTPITGTPVTDENYSASATASYTGTAGNLLLVFVSTQSDKTFTASSCTTLETITHADGNIGSGFVGYVEATGSSQTIGATWTGDDNWRLAIIEVNAAAGGGTDYPIDCAVGAFTLTGQTAGTVYGAVESASAGSFALTGQDAGLKFATIMASNTGAFTITGHNAGLSYGTILVANKGDFTLTGNDTTFALGITMAFDAGSYTLAGNDASLTRGAVLDGDAGTFTLTGKNASLVAGYIVVTDTGAFLLTGQGAGTAFATAMSSDPGTFALTGNDTTFKLDYTLNAETGVFTITGNAAGLGVSGGSGGIFIIGIAI